jgi:hypothetical protein
MAVNEDSGRTLAGYPLWLWGVGAAAAVGGYLYITHSSPQSPGGDTGGGDGTSSPTGLTSSTFRLWVIQHQASPPRAEKRKKGRVA